jgi:hypothetical protein
LKTSIVAASIGTAIGILLAFVLFCAGPRVIEWINGPRLETEAWVFYVTQICGAGFGAVAGAVIGAARALADVMRTRP